MLECGRLVSNMVVDASALDDIFTHSLIQEKTNCLDSCV